MFSELFAFINRWTWLQSGVICALDKPVPIAIKKRASRNSAHPADGSLFSVVNDEMFSLCWPDADDDYFTHILEP